MQFFKDVNVDFIAFRRKAMAFSAALILISLFSVFFHKGLRQGIDFAGGALIELKMDPPVPLGQVRSIVNNTGFTGAEITRFGSPDEYLIKIKSIGNATEVADSLRQLLVAGAGHGQSVDIRRVESVGPKIGSELRTAAFWAIIYSLLGIIAYVSWRFQFRFAIAAILALVHDVTITLGFFSVANLEVSLAVIAAILTIVGYSLNDTIVVFDRIRENLHTRRRDNYERLVSASINETLSRTVITSLTTLFVIVCLVLFGGEVIRDFALTLLVGVTVGTYSSIFIASPILVEWQLWHASKKGTRGG